MNRAEIKRRRTAMGLTLAEAAKRAGWRSQVQWHDAESGKKPDPRISAIAKVAAVLKCRIDDLMK